MISSARANTESTLASGSPVLELWVSGNRVSAHYAGTTFLLWETGNSPLFPSLYPHFLWTAGLSTTVDNSVRSAQFFCFMDLSMAGMLRREAARVNSVSGPPVDAWWQVRSAQGSQAGWVAKVRRWD
jgi:hypothetical protein